jgi:hypothetical protein
MNVSLKNISGADGSKPGKVTRAPNPQLSLINQNPTTDTFLKSYSSSGRVLAIPTHNTPVAKSGPLLAQVLEAYANNQDKTLGNLAT